MHITVQCTDQGQVDKELKWHSKPSQEFQADI